MSEERRVTGIDEAKFATQRTLTYLLVTIFAASACFVFYKGEESSISMVLQTIINLTLLAVGYWLGASKAAADSTGTIGKIAEQAAPRQAEAVAAARAPAGDAPPVGVPVATDTINVAAENVNVNQEKDK